VDEDEPVSQVRISAIFASSGDETRVVRPGWFAGLMPVSGGIGVAAAGYVIGLTAFGVPEPIALAVALTNRFITTYMPPIIGFFMMKRLERAGYL